MNQQNQNNYQLLISKLDAFIRKYYKNKILKGGILVGSILLISFLLVSVLEYFGHFNSTVRTVLFYSYVLINISIIAYYILIPLFNLYKIGKIISYDQAASIIGAYFGDVKDKLLNALQLRNMSEQDAYNRALIEASIDQKANELKPVPFNSAISFKDNRKYFKYFVIPIIVVLILLIGVPEVLTESTARLVEYNKYFEKPSPFEFIVLNDDMEAVRYEDFLVQLQVKSDAVPDKVYISFDGKEHLMERSKADRFEFNIRKLRSDLSFYFRVADYVSNKYDLKVLPKPGLKKFEIQLTYPAYINKAPDVVENIGDLTIPKGTTLKWNFYTQDVDQMSMQFEHGNELLDRTAKDHFSLKKRFLQNDFYSIRSKNAYVQSDDSILYYINVIPDAYPRINVSRTQDSFSTKFLFFTGEVSDDYGLSKLTFNYRFTNVEDTSGKKLSGKFEIPLTASLNLQSFLYSYDLNDLSISAGDIVEYYFEVWDNDGVSGPKSSVSDRFYYESPTKKEVEEKTESLAENIKEQMEDAVKRAHELQEDFEKAREKLMDHKSLNWDDKKFVEELVQKQKELGNDIEKIKQDYIENVTMKDEFQELSEEILDKYEKLYEMFEELMPEEIKELYDELDKLMDKNMKDQIQDELENMNLNNKDVEKELDRMLELFKQFEFEQKTNEVIEKLKDLAEKQDELAKKGEEKNSDAKELEEQQKRLNEDFEDIKEDVKKMEELNENLMKPNKMDDFSPDEEEIDSEQQQGMQNLKENKQKKASQNQKNAAKKMKEMAEKMQEMQMQMEMKSLEINIQKLRQILENLVYLSFEQEKLMDEFKSVNSYNPRYVELAQQQQKLKLDAKMIEDSLFVLSKELPMIESMINKEMTDLNYNMKKTIDHLSAREIPDARANQQFIMTSVNNVAVLLSEILQQLQNEMSSNSMGKSCSNPKKGKNKPGLGNIKKLQESLNQQIEDLKKGQKPGQGKMSKQLAKMAAQQEMLRNELRKMEMEQKKNGQKPFGDLDKIQELMEETEKDLVNKKITNETLRRQKEITVKLLEAEKAELEQGKEEKRKSKSARDIFKTNPPSLEEYNKQKMKEVEMLQSLPPSLSPFYRIKVKEYFEQLKY